MQKRRVGTISMAIVLIAFGDGKNTINILNSDEVAVDELG